MKLYNTYIRLILITKILFVLLSMFHIYLKVTKKGDSDLDKKIVYWKSRLEFVFIILMSLLLIYLFHPTIDRRHIINKETRFLLYLFGFILIITADWSDFIKEAPLLKLTQQLLGRE